MLKFQAEISDRDRDIAIWRNPFYPHTVWGEIH